jgi:hypothetical protein
MAMGQPFATTPTVGLEPRAAGGTLLEAEWPRMRAALVARLGRAHAALFADPARADDRIAWSTPLDGVPIPADRLDPAQRAHATARAAAMLADIRAAAERMAPESATAREVARLLLTLAEADSAGKLWVAGTQPILVLWTHEGVAAPAWVGPPSMASALSTAPGAAAVPDMFATPAARAVGGRALPFAAIAVACLVLVAAALFARMAVAQAGNAGLIVQKNALEEQLNQLLAGEPAACAKPTH